MNFISPKVKLILSEICQCCCLGIREYLEGTQPLPWGCKQICFYNIKYPGQALDILTSKMDCDNVWVAMASEFTLRSHNSVLSN